MTSPKLVAACALASLVCCARLTEAGETVHLPKAAVDVPQAKAGEKKTAVLAMGCFWCSEAVFEQIEGVSEVVSGFAGGTAETAHYETVSEGATKHAESIRITYDPSRVTYADLLRIFFTTHDPTTKDRQGPDSGHQYRSAIFFGNDDEKRVAEAYIKQLEAAKIWSAPIVTTLEPLSASGFYPAEEYHQDFVARHPDHPYVRAWSVPKLTKLMKSLPELLKKR